MSNTSISKIPLEFNLYEKYEIPQDYPVFIVEANNIELEAVDDLEYEYLSQGNKIFHSEISRTNEGKYNLKLVIGKLSFTT